jgi:AcrR family transcriptional regulator
VSRFRRCRAQRREQILAAATEAFARSGFAATSLDDIAAEAGVTLVVLYRERIEKFRADITAAAFLQIVALVPDEGLARWAAQLAPVVAIEAVTAWLDTGQPDPARAAARIRQAVMGVIGAAVASDAACSFPLPPDTEGTAS